ncbi:hypothetical protein D3C81_1139320 [compost metagenome]
MDALFEWYGNDSRRSPNGNVKQSDAGPLSACCRIGDQCAVLGSFRSINVSVAYALGSIFHRHGYARLSGSGSDFDSEKYGAGLCRSGERYPVSTIYGLYADHDEHVRMAEESVVRYGDVSVSRCVFWIRAPDYFAFVPKGTID